LRVPGISTLSVYSLSFSVRSSRQPRVPMEGHSSSNSCG
jgi:hypothetical protein